MKLTTMGFVGGWRVFSCSVYLNMQTWCCLRGELVCSSVFSYNNFTRFFVNKLYHVILQRAIWDRGLSRRGICVRVDSYIRDYWVLLKPKWLVNMNGLMLSCCSLIHLLLGTGHFCIQMGYFSTSNLGNWGVLWITSQMWTSVHRVLKHKYLVRQIRSKLCFFYCLVARVHTYLFTYLITHLLTYFMEQSPFWAANRFSGSQEIPSILWNTEVRYRIHKRQPPVPILSQISPVHTPIPFPEDPF